jgi:ABC-2 type transport system permease protein
MPRWLQLISYIIPAKYGLIIVRSILLKGVGLEILREQVMAILLFTAIIVTLASTRFKKKLG